MIVAQAESPTGLRAALLAIHERLDLSYDICNCYHETRCIYCIAAECWSIADAALKGETK